MDGLKYSKEVCEACDTHDCLIRCSYIKMDLKTAKEERQRLLRGENSRVLTECVTCYACEEYCPHGNHPFYLIVERQEQLGIWPVPQPLNKGIRIACQEIFRRKFFHRMYLLEMALRGKRREPFYIKGEWRRTQGCPGLRRESCAWRGMMRKEVRSRIS